MIEDNISMPPSYFTTSSHVEKLTQYNINTNNNNNNDYKLMGSVFNPLKGTDLLERNLKSNSGFLNKCKRTILFYLSSLILK